MNWEGTFPGSKQSMSRMHHPPQVRKSWRHLWQLRRWTVKNVHFRDILQRLQSLPQRPDIPTTSKTSRSTSLMPLPTAGRPFSETLLDEDSRWKADQSEGEKEEEKKRGGGWGGGFVQLRNIRVFKTTTFLLVNECFCRKLWVRARQGLFKPTQTSSAMQSRVALSGGSRGEWCVDSLQEVITCLSTSTFLLVLYR